MEQNLGIMLVVLVMSFGPSNLQAQETLPASGGNASGGGGTANFTVGQVFYSLHTEAGGSQIQGVQQPYEIFVLQGLEDPYGIKLLCSVYPNPTADNLILHLEELPEGKMMYRLIDFKGELIDLQRIRSNITNIDMTRLGPAIYLLLVTRNGIEVKTFKIIKN